MIHYCIQAQQAFTIEEYLGLWGSALAPGFAVRRYEQLRTDQQLTGGVYIVSGVDQLGTAGRALAASLACQLEATGAARVINHPDRALQRAALLNVLHERGFNEFRAVPITASLDSLRYPVFLRRASRHDGPLSPLLHSPAAVEAAIGWEALAGQPLDDLLIVEYLDTSRDGEFRKYAAFAVGDRVIARSLSYGRQWMRKHRDSLFTRAMVEEELEYVSTNPHARELAKIFSLANVEYGRIDYSLHHGRIQTWEINLNPTVGRGARPSSGRVPSALEPTRTESKRAFYESFAAAFTTLNHSRPAVGAVRLTFPQEQLLALRDEQRMAGQTPSRVMRLARRFVRPVLSPALAIVGQRARR